MYRNFTASEYKEQLSLADDYKVDGFLVYGVSHKGPYEILKDRLAAGNATVEYGLLHGFLEPILEFRVSNQRFWFVTAYGGAILSEWLHLACLFGSKINLLLGSCGGLHIEAKSRDLIVPTYSYANESTTRAYEPEANHRHYANQELRTNIINCLRTGMHKVWEGPTVTHQAMMAETWEDVQSWSQDGFYGVEMEASTIFAVSNYFRIPSAAILRLRIILLSNILYSILTIRRQAAGMNGQIFNLTYDFRRESEKMKLVCFGDSITSRTEGHDHPLSAIFS